MSLLRKYASCMALLVLGSATVVDLAPMAIPSSPGLSSGHTSAFRPYMKPASPSGAMAQPDSPQEATVRPSTAVFGGFGVFNFASVAPYTTGAPAAVRGSRGFPILLESEVYPPHIPINKRKRPHPSR